MFWKQYQKHKNLFIIVKYTPLTKNLQPLENVISNADLRRPLRYAAKEYFFLEKWGIFKYCLFCENTLLINILWGNPTP